MSSQVGLRLLLRTRCMFDDPVQVKVAGLRPRQVVTVTGRATDEHGVVFSSLATYRADDSGEIDLERQPSLGGTFVGLEPQGLLWSMTPATLHSNFRKEHSGPQVMKFSVREVEREGRILAEATSERFVLGDGVSRLPIKQGNVVGVLFTPPGKGPFPAVLDLCTFRSELRASLLANKGFVVLTVAVLRKNVNHRLHLDHFEEAAEFLKTHPKVDGKGIGVVARSKATDIALALASFVPGIKAVVWINGCSGNVFYPLYYKSRQILSAIPIDVSRTVPSDSGAIIIKSVLGDPMAEENKGSLFPIENAEARFLFAASLDDLNWDSKAFMDQLVERLKHHGKDNFETVSYPGAGHTLETPYVPYCPSSLHIFAGNTVQWGGDGKSQSRAEVHLWKKTQEFFRTHLSCDTCKTKAKM